MSPVVEEIGRRITRMNDIVSELTLGPTLMRLTVVAATFGGLVLAWANESRSGSIVITFGVVAFVAGVFPRSPLPTMCALAIALGYVATTGNGTPITLWRLSTLAALIYVLHTAAAYAAVLPYNAVLTRGTFVPYVMRSAAVIAITVGVAYFTLTVTSVVTAGRTVVATIVGMLMIVAVAGYLAYLGSRRRTLPPPAEPRRRGFQDVDATGEALDRPSLGRIRERANK
jgi:hypothetical protein